MAGVRSGISGWVIGLLIRRRAGAERRAANEGKNKATANQSPWLKPLRKSPIPKERLSVSNWIVHKLYDDAVKETVELGFLTIFQHIVDPARVRTVADKNRPLPHSTLAQQWRISLSRATASQCDGNSIAQ